MVEPTRLIEEKIVGSFEVGEEEAPPEAPYVEVEIVEEEVPEVPEEEYVPPYAPPAEAPLAPSRREEVTRSAFYVEHEKIFDETVKAADRGVCKTPKELASITNIDIDSVKEHLSLLELSEAVKPVQDNDNPATCHIDRLAKKLRTLRER